MLGKLRRIASRGRRNEILWRYAFNLVPTVNYRLRHFAKLNDAQRDVIRQLDQDGIAITSAERCGDALRNFEELEDCVRRLLDDRSEELDALKERAQGDGAIGDKTFNVELLGSPLQFDPESVYARFALQDFIQEIANAYLGMSAELRYYNVWKTFATSARPRESQLWHFDREDNYILKVFLYLDDVDESAGPFTYAPGTHRKGRRWDLQPEFFFEDNVKRSSDQQMSRVVPESEWVRATGRKGTLIFADTRGFHKGGEAREKDRLMYTCMFTSPASQSKRLLIYSVNNGGK